MEQKALPPHYNNQKDEDLSGVGRKDGSNTHTCQSIQAPTTRHKTLISGRTMPCKRAAPKRFRPSPAPKPYATMCLPATVSKSPTSVKPKTNVQENRPPPLENGPVHNSTPWPGAG